jgi:hypothetical protein
MDLYQIVGGSLNMGLENFSKILVKLKLVL